MDNQHKKIKGFRDLSPQEIDLMNRIKSHAEETAKLLEEVKTLRGLELSNYNLVLTQDQINESFRCLAIAKTSMQTGQMWFVRAVALPESF